jgi:hypothetical protein
VGGAGGFGVGLWEVLRAGGSAQNIAHVEKLSKYAAGKLTLVRDTFPDYTLHDERHAENVIKLVEQLLGPRMDKVTALEAAMLILAAYFHDIGMVYEPDELAALGDDEDFRAFLDENPAAYIRVHEAGDTPPDIVVQYCRARHAKRVSDHLFQFESDELFWDGAGIARQLARLCRSHNEPLDALRSDELSTNFLAECDLRMCAILLRLADILDLDDTRSPAAVYDHLRLAKASAGPRAVSDAEWTKHMASSGFRFPPERTPNYLLAFLASPRRPAVENAIRKFLDVVDEELRGCRILLDFCDPRWRSLPLPGSVDRSNITSIGYRYGEYRFSLDRQAVLRLFMGDQLYRDPYVFIRELLQNAVDACRLNVYLHDVPPDSMEVRVSAWEDEAGFYWLRVDDTGVGMDQGIVEKYFLGVGRSYYRSDELQADILRKNKPQHEFVAISRFGIGVLSSFIVGDRIEVSTRRRLPDGTLAAPLRLSLDSLDDFFVMQEQPNHPRPFPGRAGPERGYRKSVGTSVAVRIDPSKSDVALASLLEQAREAFHYPPVRVYLNDAEQPDCRLAQLDVPLLDAPVRCGVAGEPLFGARADLPAALDVTVAAFALDLTANSPSQAVRGQLIALFAEASGSASLLPALPASVQDRLPEDLARVLENCITGCDVSIAQDNDTGELRLNLYLSCRDSAMRALRAWFRDQAGSRSADAHPDPGFPDRSFQDLFSLFLDDPSSSADDTTVSASYPIDLTNLIGEQAAGRLSRDWLGHNGIRVPVRLETPRLASQPELRLMPRGQGVIFGPLSLSDQLRPDVSVSRDGLRGLSFDIRSALQLAVRRAAAVYLDGPEKHAAAVLMRYDLLRDLPLRDVTADQVEADPLAPEWHNEQIFRVGQDDWRNVAEVRELARNSPVELAIGGYVWSRDLDSRHYAWGASFFNIYRSSLAERGLDLQVTPVHDDNDNPRLPEITVCGAEQPVRPAGLSVLPPFAAVRYASAEVMIAPHSPANLSNPIVAWFADHAVPLNADYPALFAQFRRALAIVANDEEEPDGGVQPAHSAAALLNATLDRIRRSVPYAAPALSAEAYAGEHGWLLSRA